MESKSISIILQLEGGFVDNPDDPGGATNMGITQTTYDDWRASAIVVPSEPPKPRSVSLLTSQEAWLLYSENYWRPARASAMDWPLNLVHFDSAVNHGVRKAARLLQEVLGVSIDGAIGPITMAALGGMGSYTTAEKLLWKRLGFYYVISQTPKQLQFLRGWISRLMLLRKEYAV